jgi:hypothetical protein
MMLRIDLWENVINKKTFVPLSGHEGLKIERQLNAIPSSSLL